MRVSKQQLQSLIAETVKKKLAENDGMGMERDEPFDRDGYIGLISDLYKEINNFRPRYDWSKFSDEDLKKVATDLQDQATEMLKGDNPDYERDAHVLDQEDQEMAHMGMDTPEDLFPSQMGMGKAAGLRGSLGSRALRQVGENTVRITESELRKLVSEAVAKKLRESSIEEAGWLSNMFGGKKPQQAGPATPRDENVPLYIAHATNVGPYTAKITDWMTKTWPNDVFKASGGGLYLGAAGTQTIQQYIDQNRNQPNPQFVLKHIGEAFGTAQGEPTNADIQNWLGQMFSLSRNARKQNEGKRTGKPVLKEKTEGTLVPDAKSVVAFGKEFDNLMNEMIEKCQALADKGEGLIDTNLMNHPEVGTRNELVIGKVGMLRTMANSLATTWERVRRYLG